MIQNWPIPEKNPNWGEWEGWGYVISRGIKKEIACGISRGEKWCEISRGGDHVHTIAYQEKIMWNFQWSLLLALEFPRDLTQLSGICWGWPLFCLEFPGLMIPQGGGSKKYILNLSPSLPLWIFSGIAYWTLNNISIIL